MERERTRDKERECVSVCVCVCVCVCLRVSVYLCSVDLVVQWASPASMLCSGRAVGVACGEPSDSSESGASSISDITDRQSGGSKQRRCQHLMASVGLIPDQSVYFSKRPKPLPTAP